MNELLFSEEFTPAAPTTMNENGHESRHKLG